MMVDTPQCHNTDKFRVILSKAEKERQRALKYGDLMINPKGNIQYLSRFMK